MENWQYDDQGWQRMMFHRADQWTPIARYDLSSFQVTLAVLHRQAGHA
jgi:hypothetical protein